MSSKAIGVFDSGVGGLTVVRELMSKLPQENIIYFGDTARVPYGTKSFETIKRFSLQNCNFLLSKGVKAIVVACNSASAAALETLQKYSPVPVFGVIDAGVNGALKATKNKRIGIIGTNATVRSKLHERKLKEIDPSIEVFSQACPLFVPIIEEGLENKEIIRETIKHYLSYFLDKNIDTLILGCTHYPVLQKEINLFLGNNVNIVDPSIELTLALEKVLNNEVFKNNSTDNLDNISRSRFFVSDVPEHFIKSSEKIIQMNAEQISHVSIDSFHSEEILKLEIEV